MNDFITIFTRDKSSVSATVLGEETGMSKWVIADTMPFVSYAYNLFVNSQTKYTGLLSIIDAFIHEIFKISIHNVQTAEFLTNRVFDVLSNADRVNKFVSIFQVVDINITDIQVMRNNEGKPYSLNFIHSSPAGNFKLDFREESLGTINLLSLMMRIEPIIEQGGILVVDELNAHLHPKLVEKIIHMFTDSKNKQAQLIFNSHDVWNMNKDNFRRDEIWFVYRDEKLSSHLVCLSDMVDKKGETQVRKDAKYSKQYMEGRYGADPFISQGFGKFL